MFLLRHTKRRVSKRSLVASIERLESRVALSVTIQLDYTYDNANYFTNNPAAKTVLEQAAQFLGSHLNDHLSAIPANGGPGNSWTAVPFDPRNVNATLSLPNLAVPADTIIVYAGAYNLGGSTLGIGGPGGFSSGGTQAWNTLIQTRGQAGAATTPQRDDGTWGGSITFNSSAAFTYSDINTAPGTGGTDFLSVALHELGHVLGLVPGEASYGYRDIGTNTFTGPHAEASYGGPVPLDSTGKHWANGTLSNGKRTSLDPIAPSPGQRALYSALDWAGLADTGWEDDSLAFAVPPPSSLFSGSTFSLSVASVYGDGSVDTTYNGPITLSLASGPAGGILQGTLTVNATNGVATFSGLSLSTVGTGYTIKAASDADTPPAISSPITVNQSVQATKLVVTTQPPSSISAGSTFGLTVKAEDASGNVDTTFASSVALAIATNPGGSTLGGTTTVTASAGVATFTGLTLNQIANGYILQVTTSGLTLANTSAINVTQATAPLDLAANLTTSSYGQSLVFTLSLATISGLPAPTGTAQFQIDGVNFGTPVTIASGKAVSPTIGSLGAGNHSITASYSGDSTYGAEATNTLTETVSKAGLTITAESKSKTYGAANPAFTVTYSGFVLNQDPSVLGGTAGFSTTATTASHVGTYPITPSGQTSSNYTISFVTGNLSVTAVALTVTADAKTKSYGTSNPTFTATYSGFVLGQSPSDLTGSLSLSSTATTSSHVGIYPITPSGQTSTDYAISYVAGNLSVTTASLTITADSKSKTYGSANPALTVSYSGFVLNQNSSVLSGTLAISTSAMASSHVGTYPITPGGLTSSDYAITYVAGNLDVTAANLTIAADPKTKSYGSANPALTATYTGFVLGQGPSDLTGTLSLSTTATPSSHVGTYPITPSGQTSSDYAISFVGANLGVTTVPLTIKADPQTRTYGAANPTLSVSYSGFVLNQDASDLGGTLVVSTTATTSSHPGSYPITPSGQTSTDYAISYVGGTLGVTTAPLIISADLKVKTYGAAPPTFTATYTGFVLGQGPSDLSGSLTLSSTATASSHVGTYPITLSGQTSNDYAVTYVAGNLDVTPANLTITADPKSKTYGIANPTFTVSYSGFVLNQNSSALIGTLAFSTPATSSSHVGIYSITPSGQTSTDYDINFEAGTLGVTTAPLIITANPQTKSYGSANPKFTASYSGFVLNDDASGLGGTPAFSTTATASSHVGTYPITPSGQTSTDYAINFVAGTLSVTTVPLTITTDPQTKTYGTVNPTFTATYSGFVLGQSPIDLNGSLSLSSTATTSSHVGTYPITPSGQTSTDYTITYIARNLTVTTAPLIVTADPATKIYGQANPSFSVNYQGFVLGQGAANLLGNVAFSTTATPSSHVGTYPITPNGLSSIDYTIHFVEGALEVTPAALTVNAVSPDRAYGAANPAFSAQYSGFVLNQNSAVLGGILAFSTLATPASHVGTYSVTPSGLTSSDYSIQYVASSFSIVAAPLRIVADTYTRVYGSANPTLTASFMGLQNGDTQASFATPLILSTPAAQTSHVGSFPITASGATDPDYTIQFVDGTMTIVPALLTISAPNLSKIYRTPNPNLGVSYSGFVNGDTSANLLTPPSVATSATAASHVGAYAIVVTGAQSNDYQIADVDGTLTITPVPLTITAVSTSKVYGSVNPIFGATYSGFVSGEDASVLSGTLGFSTQATTTSHVGNYAVTPAGVSSSDYSIQYLAGALAITPAPLTITPVDATQIYGQSGPILTATYSGFVAGDTASSLASPVFLTSIATPASHVGSYPITASGSLSSDYQIQFGTGHLQINPTVLTITANDQSIVKGSALPAFSASYSGFVNGDTPASLTMPASLSTEATSASPSGTYSIIISGATSSDYSIVLHPGTLTIQAPVAPPPPPPPLVVVQRVQLKTIKIRKKKVTVIVATFSGDLDPDSAQFSGSYKLVSPGKDKKYGTKDDKTLAIKSAVYDTLNRVVTLTPKAALTFSPSVQLKLSGSSIHEKNGRLIDGDKNGVAGGDAVVILTKKSV